MSSVCNKNSLMYYITTMLALARSLANQANVAYNEYAVNTELGIASKIGKSILERGGNAMDAAIAAGLAIGVVNSFSAGIGGGGFMLIKKTVGGNDHFDSFDFRETAPKNISTELFKQPGASSKTTGLSVAVPGEVLGYFEAHRQYGRLPWQDIFKDVIELAKGFTASGILVKKLEKNKEYILKDPGLCEIYTVHGRLIQEGENVSRMNLSRTLEEISKDPLSMYKGRLAERIVSFINQNNGVITIQDLQDYKVKQRSVLRGAFYDYNVYTTNIPTSGLFIIEALKILERINIRDMLHFVNEKNSFYLYHALIETFKFVISERGRFGDPDFMANWKKEVSKIISDRRARNLMKKLKFTKIQPVEEYKAAFFKEDHGTSHLNVIDSDEMMVLVTTTINLEFGSKLMDPETGIIFNNHIDDFYIPGVDNAYGLEKMETNKLAGGKRPFSSASPTVLIKEGEIIAIGAAGGTRIPTAIITTIAYFLVENSLNKAISSCRIHNQLLPYVTYVEPTLPDSVIEKLEEIGHNVQISDVNTTFTSVQAIHVRKEGGKKTILAVSDHRKGGSSDGK